MRMSSDSWSSSTDSEIEQPRDTPLHTYIGQSSLRSINEPQMKRGDSKQASCWESRESDFEKFRCSQSVLPVPNTANKTSKSQGVCLSLLSVQNWVLPEGFIQPLFDMAATSDNNREDPMSDVTVTLGVHISFFHTKSKRFFGNTWVSPEMPIDVFQIRQVRAIPSYSTNLINSSTAPKANTKAILTPGSVGLKYVLDNVPLNFQVFFLSDVIDSNCVVVVEFVCYEKDKDTNATIAMAGCGWAVHAMLPARASSLSKSLLATTSVPDSNNVTHGDMNLGKDEILIFKGSPRLLWEIPMSLDTFQNFHEESSYKFSITECESLRNIEKFVRHHEIVSMLDTIPGLKSGNLANTSYDDKYKFPKESLMCNYDHEHNHNKSQIEIAIEAAGSTTSSRSEWKTSMLSKHFISFSLKSIELEDAFTLRLLIHRVIVRQRREVENDMIARLKIAQHKKFERVMTIEGEVSSRVLKLSLHNGRCFCKKAVTIPLKVSNFDGSTQADTDVLSCATIPIKLDGYVAHKLMAVIISLQYTIHFRLTWSQRDKKKVHDKQMTKLPEENVLHVMLGTRILVPSDGQNVYVHQSAYPMTNSSKSTPIQSFSMELRSGAYCRPYTDSLIYTKPKNNMAANYIDIGDQKASGLSKLAFVELSLFSDIDGFDKTPLNEETKAIVAQVETHAPTEDTEKRSAGLWAAMMLDKADANTILAKALDSLASSTQTSKATMERITIPQNVVQNPQSKAEEIYTDDNIQNISNTKKLNVPYKNVDEMSRATKATLERHGYMSRATKATLERHGYMEAHDPYLTSAANTHSEKDDIYLCRQKQNEKELCIPQERFQNPDILKELNDPYNKQEIRIHFAAFTRHLLPTETQLSPSRIYFSFQFYDFPATRTEPTRLCPAMSNDQIKTKYLLMHERIANKPSLATLFDIDFANHRNPAARREFCTYLSSHALSVEVWDADSLFLLGTLQLPLRGLLRQGKSVAKVYGEADIRCGCISHVPSATPDEVFTNLDGSRGSKHDFHVVGKVHFLMSNYGVQTARKVTTSDSNLDECHQHTIQSALTQSKTRVFARPIIETNIELRQVLKQSGFYVDSESQAAGKFIHSKTSKHKHSITKSCASFTLDAEDINILIERFALNGGNKDRVECDIDEWTGLACLISYADNNLASCNSSVNISEHKREHICNNLSCKLPAACARERIQIQEIGESHNDSYLNHNPIHEGNGQESISYADGGMPLQCHENTGAEIMHCDAKNIKSLDDVVGCPAAKDIWTKNYNMLMSRIKDSSSSMDSLLQPLVLTSERNTAVSGCSDQYNVNNPVNEYLPNVSLADGNNTDLINPIVRDVILIIIARIEQMYSKAKSFVEVQASITDIGANSQLNDIDTINQSSICNLPATAKNSAEIKSTKLQAISSGRNESTNLINESENQSFEEVVISYLSLPSFIHTDKPTMFGRLDECFPLSQYIQEETSADCFTSDLISISNFRFGVCRLMGIMEMNRWSAELIELENKIMHCSSASAGNVDIINKVEKISMAQFKEWISAHLPPLFFDIPKAAKYPIQKGDNIPIKNASKRKAQSMKEVVARHPFSLVQSNRGRSDSVLSSNLSDKVSKHSIKSVDAVLKFRLLLQIAEYFGVAISKCFSYFDKAHTGSTSIANFAHQLQALSSEFRGLPLMDLDNVGKAIVGKTDMDYSQPDRISITLRDFENFAQGPASLIKCVKPTDVGQQTKQNLIHKSSQPCDPCMSKKQRSSAAFKSSFYQTHNSPDCSTPYSNDASYPNNVSGGQKLNPAMNLSTISSQNICCHTYDFHSDPHIRAVELKLVDAVKACRSKGIIPIHILHKHLTEESSNLSSSSQKKPRKKYLLRVELIQVLMELGFQIFASDTENFSESKTLSNPKVNDKTYARQLERLKRYALYTADKRQAGQLPLLKTVNNFPKHPIIATNNIRDYENSASTCEDFLKTKIELTKRFQLYRNGQKKSITNDLLRAHVTRELDIFIRFGETKFIELVARNPYPHQERMRLDIDEIQAPLQHLLEIDLVRDKCEWDYFRSNSKSHDTAYICAPRSNCVRKNYIEDEWIDGENELIMQAFEEINVPIRIRWLGSHTPQSIAPSSRDSPTSKISIYLRSCGNGSTLTLFQLNIFVEKFICDRIFRFTCDGEGGAIWRWNLNIPKCYHLVCFDASVVVEELLQGDAQMVYLKRRVGKYPALESFFVLIYGDSYYATLFETWQIRIQTTMQLDLHVHYGQSLSNELLINGDLKESRRVKCFNKCNHQAQNDNMVSLLQFDSTSGLALVPGVLNRFNFKLSTTKIPWKEPTQNQAYVNDYVSIVQLVDIDREELIGIWSIAAHISAPVVTKTYDIVLPIGKTTQKKILYENCWDLPQTISITSSDEAQLKSRDSMLRVDAHTQTYLRLTFSAVENSRCDKIYLFLNDNFSSQQEECLLFSVIYK